MHFGSRKDGMQEIMNDIKNKLDFWLNNPPDYHDMHDVYTRYGKLRGKITLLKRRIQRTEEIIMEDIEKPRSNEAKKMKINATAQMLDTLAGYESELCELEAEIKILEFQKTMFNAATFRSRMENMS